MRKLTPQKIREIKALKAQGFSERDIAARVGVSKGSVGGVALDAPKSEAPKSPPVLPSDEEIEGTDDLKTIDGWLETVAGMAAGAKASGNGPLLARTGTLALSLLEAKRKATPPVPPDPNENPDLIALSDQAETTLLRMVDELFNPTGNP